MFNINKFYALSMHHVCVDLGAISDYFPICYVAETDRL